MLVDNVSLKSRAKKLDKHSQGFIKICLVAKHALVPVINSCSVNNYKSQKHRETPFNVAMIFFGHAFSLDQSMSSIENT